MLGVDGRYSSLGHYSNTKSNGNTYVKLEAALDGQSLVVEIGYKCPEFPKSGEGLRYTLGGTTVERGHVKDTRKELSDVLSVSAELAEWTAYVDGDKLKFNKMGERQSVGLLMDALRQPKWDDVSKRASKLLSDAKSARQDAESWLENAKSTLARLTASVATAKTDYEAERVLVAKEKASAKARLANVSTERARKAAEVTTLETRQKAIKKELKKIVDNSSEAFMRLETQAATLKTAESLLHIGRQRLVELRATVRANHTNASSVLLQMRNVPKDCPSCGKPWDKAHGAEEITRQEATVAALASDLADAERSIASLDSDLATNRADAAKIQEQVTALRTPAKNEALSREFERNENLLNSLCPEVANLRVEEASLASGPDETELARLKAIVEERERQVTSGQAAVENGAVQLAEASEMAKVLAYWNEAFGPCGIPNMVLSEAVNPLNDVSKRLSALLTNGTIGISYATSRTLATGRSSSELVVKVDNKLGGCRIEGSSKGESGLTNLILAETLSEVGSVSQRVGFRWYDECLSNQDATVRRSILAYLRETAQRLGILIFVVDHHAESASFADHVLVAEKNDDGTSLYWR